jgi:hypothetical protein
MIRATRTIIVRPVSDLQPAFALNGGTQAFAKLGDVAVEEHAGAGGKLRSMRKETSPVSEQAGLRRRPLRQLFRGS